jgi:hypothetical protein
MGAASGAFGEVTGEETGIIEPDHRVWEVTFTGD